MNSNNISSTINDLNNEMQYLHNRIPVEKDIKKIKQMMRYMVSISSTINKLTEIKMLSFEIRKDCFNNNKININSFVIYINLIS